MQVEESDSGVMVTRSRARAKTRVALKEKGKKVTTGDDKTKIG